MLRLLFWPIFLETSMKWMDNMDDRTWRQQPNFFLFQAVLQKMLNCMLAPS